MPSPVEALFEALDTRQVGELSREQFKVSRVCFSSHSTAVCLQCAEDARKVLCHGGKRGTMFRDIKDAFSSLMPAAGQAVTKQKFVDALGPLVGTGSAEAALMKDMTKHCRQNVPIPAKPTSQPVRSRADAVNEPPSSPTRAERNNRLLADERKINRSINRALDARRQDQTDKQQNGTPPTSPRASKPKYDDFVNKDSEKRVSLSDAARMLRE